MPARPQIILPERPRVQTRIRAVESMKDMDSLLDIYPKVITDPNDQMTNDEIVEVHEKGLARSYIVADWSGLDLGFYMGRINRFLPQSNYGPYYGIVPALQGRGYGTAGFNLLKQDLNLCGVEEIYFDFEDPRRIKGVYAPEKKTHKVAYYDCFRRFDFWYCVGCQIVYDDVWYARYSSEDPQMIQAYDCFAKCYTDNNNPELTSPDAYAIIDGVPCMSMDLHHDGYIKLFQLEGQDPDHLADEAQMRAKWPAVKHFLSQEWEPAYYEQGKRWVKLYQFGQHH